MLGIGIIVSLLVDRYSENIQINYGQHNECDDHDDPDAPEQTHLPNPSNDKGIFTELILNS